MAEFVSILSSSEKKKNIGYPFQWQSVSVFFWLSEKSIFLCGSGGTACDVAKCTHINTISPPPQLTAPNWPIGVRDRSLIGPPGGKSLCFFVFTAKVFFRNSLPLIPYVKAIPSSCMEFFLGRKKILVVCDILSTVLGLFKNQLPLLTPSRIVWCLNQVKWKKITTTDTLEKKTTTKTFIIFQKKQPVFIPISVGVCDGELGNPNPSSLSIDPCFEVWLSQGYVQHPPCVLCATCGSQVCRSMWVFLITPLQQVDNDW